MLKKSTIVALAVTFASAPYAMAANYPTQVYDATYEMVSPLGKSPMRQVSDGKGHYLVQSSAGGRECKTMIDYLNKETVTLLVKEKMAIKGKLADGYVNVEDKVKQSGGKSLGAKNVNGHPCHGFEYVSQGTKEQVWLGDDCKIPVQSTTDSKGGKIVMDLKSVSLTPPSADTFKVPAGYKMMDQ
jgi:hypothetical protein